MTTRTERGSTPAARQAAVAWHTGQQDAICDVIAPWEHGRLVRATPYPAYWDYTAVWAAGPLDGLEAADLMRVADEHHGDLAHRDVQVQDEGAGARLRPAFERAGWRATPLVSMAHDGPLPPLPGGVSVREAADPAAVPLRRQWYATEPWAREPAALDAFLAAEGEVHERLGGHVLLVDGPGPEGLAAYVRVRVAGDAGEIAEAYVVPEARGRGIGEALVVAGARAIAAAGARHILIVAEAEGRARRLYARLGFRPVWTMHQFLRVPEGG